MKTSSYIKIGISIIVVGLLIAVIMWVKSITKGNYVAFGADTAIDVTPTQIQSIKAIGNSSP